MCGGRGGAQLPPRGVDRHREVAEERDEPLGHLGRERAGAQGAGVLLEVRRVPRSDEHDVHPRLVRHEAVGGLGQRLHPAVREEAQRIGRIEVVPADHAGVHQPADLLGELLRAAEVAARRRHDLDRDVLVDRRREEDVARRLVEEREAGHHDVPHVVLHGPGEHGVPGVPAGALRDAEEADLPLVAQRQQCRDDLGDGVVVVLGPHPVQVVDVDDVGTELRERLLQRPPDVGPGDRRAVSTTGDRLGGEHDVVAVPLERPADDVLGAVVRRGVDVVDAEFDGPPHHADGLVLGGPLLQAEPALAATAETADADPQAGAAEGPVVHAGGANARLRSVAGSGNPLRRRGGSPPRRGARPAARPARPSSSADALVVADDVGPGGEAEGHQHRPEAADGERDDRPDDPGEGAHDDVADGRAAPRGHLVERRDPAAELVRGVDLHGRVPDGRGHGVEGAEEQRRTDREPDRRGLREQDRRDAVEEGRAQQHPALPAGVLDHPEDRVRRQQRARRRGAGQDPVPGRADRQHVRRDRRQEDAVGREHGGRQVQRHEAGDQRPPDDVPRALGDAAEDRPGRGPRGLQPRHADERQDDDQQQRRSRHRPRTSAPAR